jgi:hypothetical protein
MASKVKINKKAFKGTGKALKDWVMDFLEGAPKAVKKAKEGVKQYAEDVTAKSDLSANELLSKVDDTVNLEQIKKEASQFRKFYKGKAIKDTDVIDREVNHQVSSLYETIKADHSKDMAKAAARLEKMTGNKIDPQDSEFLKKAKEVIRNSKEHQVYDMAITKQTAELMDRHNGNVEYLNSLLKKVEAHGEGYPLAHKKGRDFYDFADYDKAAKRLTIGDKKNLLKETKVQLNAYRKVAWKDLQNEGVINNIDMYASTLSGSLNTLYVLAKKRNMNTAKEAIEAMYNHIDVSHGRMMRLLSLERDVSAKWKTIESNEAKAKALRFYRENAFKDMNTVGKVLDDTNSIKYVKDGLERRSRADLESLNLTREKYGLDLDADDIEFANVLTNKYAFLRRLEAQEKSNKINKEDIPATIKEMYEKGWNQEIAQEFFTNNVTNNIHGIMDHGRSYSPIVPTEDFLTTLKQKKIDSDLQAYLYDKSQNAFAGSATYNKLRRLNSKASFDENRLLPSEEASRYLRKYRNNLIHKKGNDILVSIKSASSKDATIAKSLSDVALDIDPRYNKYEAGYNDLLKKTADQWQDAFAYTEQPKNEIAKAVLGLTDVMSAAALASPRMVAMNNFQPLATSAMFKGVMNTIYGFKKTKAYWKEMFAGKGIDGALKSITENNMTTFEKEVLDGYFRKYAPDVLQSDLWTGSARLDQVKHFITTPFRASDIYSRSVVALSSVKHADDLLAKYGKDFFKGGAKSAKAQQVLINELHIKEFNALEQKKLVQSLHQGRKQFLTEYAHQSINKELFNYSALNRPKFLDFMKKSPWGARAGRFLTWSIYYNDLVDGALRSYSAGDKEPVNNLMKISLTWLLGTSVVAGLDIPVVSDFASYAVGRTPLVSPISNTVDNITRPVGGILVPAVGALAYPFYKGLDAITDMAGSENDTFDYLSEKHGKNFYYSPVMKPYREAKKILEL